MLPHRPYPTVVILTPGVHNAAYCEHAFLAQQLGVELVTGPDLVVSDDCVFMRTVQGLERVDVIYRRVDDGFLDPETFRRESLIGVPGVMRAWRAGNVALVSAPGAGIADDKAIYAFVPDIIRYFLGEDPLLANVPTWRCGDDDDLAYVLDHLPALVIKPATESGGYGVVIGPTAGEAALRTWPNASSPVRAQLGRPARSCRCRPCPPSVMEISRPATSTSGPSPSWAPRVPTWRPEGLTRVARRKGSLIVNSSQGGGSKDTWVVDATIAPPATRATHDDDEHGAAPVSSSAVTEPQ